MRSKRILTGLALLFLMTCGTACTAIAPAAQRVLPPSSLLQTCAEPAPPSEHTLGGLVQSIHDYQSALDACNAALAALRAWAAQ